MGQNWFQIFFIENEGMAWGVELPGAYGKLFLTLFRILAVGGIAYWMHDSVKKHASNYLVVAIALILTGAFGNIVDSVFYGIIFDDSHGQVATLFSDNPYGTLFHGKVVDMFYFPIIDTIFPSWIPIVGGRPLQFFEFIFNIADSSVFIGTAIIIIFRKHFFNNNEVITSQDELEPNLEDNIPLDIENTEGDELSEVVH